jgi:hypothetical protein
MSKDEALEDCKTHREVWREAILIAQSVSKEEDDVSYWSHELAVFDQVFKTLNSLAEPVQEPVAKSFMVHLYNFGYKAGHHDTVEGRYIDICRQDMETYHLEDVSEWLQDMSYTTPPAAPIQPVGDWVWSWLMDWCKRQGVSPATQDSLFEMVKDSRIKFDK